MKKICSSICLAVALIGAPQARAGEVWNVAEGPEGAQKGSWSMTISGADVSGEAVMSAPHEVSVTYKVAGKMDKGAYVLQRLDPSDGVKCDYRGAPHPDGSIAGSATCGGRRGPWIVQPAKQ